MKKLSLDLGEGGLKGWLHKHVEKVALGGVVALSILFLYQGFSLESYQKGGPQKLQSEAAAAVQNVSTDSSFKIMSNPERAAVVDHSNRVVAASQPLDGGDYAFGMFNPIVIPFKSKRRDPQLYAPESIEVATIRAAIYEKTTAADPFAADAVAAPGKPGAERPRPTPRPTPSNSKGKNDEGVLNDSPPTARSDREMEMPRMPFGAPTTPSGAVGKEYVGNYVDGYRPQGAAEGARGVYREFNVVTAVVPHEKYLEAYKQALYEADGYDELRDAPQYLQLRVERLEVGPDPQVPLDWSKSVRLSTKSLRSRIATEWGGQMVEVADERYLEPELTMPIPPALMVSPFRLALHSKIPRVNFKDRLKTDAANETPRPEKPGAADDDLPLAGPGPGGEPGNSAGGRRPFVGGDARMPANLESGRPAAGAKPAEKVKYKLIRFYDLEIEPNKSYRYRVQVRVEDPNRPRESAAAPSVQILDSAVLNRILPLEAEDNAAGRRTFWRESPWSEPSIATTMPPALKFAVGSAKYYVTVKIKKDASTVQEVKIDESTGTLIVSEWDPARAAEVTGNPDAKDPSKDVVRAAIHYATVLNFVKESQILRPDTLQIHLVADKRFQTGAFVVDMRTSEPFPSKNAKIGKKPLFSSTEMLLVDPQGQLRIYNELDDAEEFRRLTFEGELQAPTP